MIKNVLQVSACFLFGAVAVVIIKEFTEFVHQSDPRSSQVHVRQMTFGQAVSKFTNDHFGFGHKVDTWTPSIPSEF